METLVMEKKGLSIVEVRVDQVMLCPGDIGLKVIDDGDFANHGYLLPDWAVKWRVGVDHMGQNILVPINELKG